MGEHGGHQPRHLMQNSGVPKWKRPIRMRLVKQMQQIRAKSNNGNNPVPRHYRHDGDEGLEILLDK